MPASGVAFEQANNITGTSSGSATSFATFTYAEGPMFTMTSATTVVTQAPYSGASSTISATFNIQVQAISGDVYIPNSQTGVFAFDYRKNGVALTSATASGITYVQPSGTAVSGNYYKVAQGTTATFAVHAFYSEINNPGLYDIKMKKILWKHTSNGVSVASDYMDADSSMISNGAYLQ